MQKTITSDKVKNTVFFNSNIVLACWRVLEIITLKQLYQTYCWKFYHTWAEHGFYTVAYLGYGRHGTCHGRHFDRDAKIAWKKL